MKKFLLIPYIYLAITLITFYSCNTHDHEGHDHVENGLDDHAEDDHHDHDEAADEVSLSAEEMKIIDIQFVQLEKKQLTAILKSNGILKVPNQNKADITSLIGGVVKNIYVKAGSSVKKGQTIATISNTSFITMQEEYLTLASELTLADLELDRQIELQAGNAGALKNLQAAEAKYSALQTRYSSLKKQLNMLNINTSNLSNENIQADIAVKSPINGAISDIAVNIGSFVDMNTPIAHIVDNSQLHVDLFVYEKDLDKLKIGQTIHFTLTNNPVKEYDAEIHSISNTFEESIKAVSVHADVKGDKKGLIDGMNVIASVSLEKANAMAVPVDAVVSNNGQDFIVAYQDIDSMFHRIPVMKGTCDVGYCEIMPLQEIEASDKIVSKGAFFILAKMTNKGEGHAH